MDAMQVASADVNTLDELLKPLGEKDCHERQYCKRGRDWDMTEVKRLLLHARQQDFDSFMESHNKLEWSLVELLVQFDHETVEPDKPLVVWSQGLLQLCPIAIYGSGKLQALDANFSFENSNVWLLGSCANPLNPNEWNPSDVCNCVCGALFVRGGTFCPTCWGLIIYAVDRHYIENAEISALLDSRLRFTQSADTVTAALAPAPHGAVAKAAATAAPYARGRW